MVYKSYSIFRRGGYEMGKNLKKRRTVLMISAAAAALMMLQHREDLKRRAQEGDFEAFRELHRLDSRDPVDLGMDWATFQRNIVEEREDGTKASA